MEISQLKQFNTMTRIFKTLIFLLAINGIAHSQSNIAISADARLFDVFDSELVLSIERENPNLLLYYNMFLEDSYEIIELPYKHESIDLYSSLDIPEDIDPSEINVLQYRLDLKEDEFVLYRLGKTNYLLKFYSMNDFNEKYNQARLHYGLLQNY